MCYTVEVNQTIRGRVYSTAVAYNLPLVDAQDLAYAYRQHEGVTARILAYPAIPYTQPYTPQEVH